jgi:hypothetical protein
LIDAHLKKRVDLFIIFCSRKIILAKNEKNWFSLGSKSLLKRLYPPKGKEYDCQPHCGFGESEREREKKKI